MDRLGFYMGKKLPPISRIEANAYHSEKASGREHEMACESARAALYDTLMELVDDLGSVV